MDWLIEREAKMWDGSEIEAEDAEKTEAKR
jgi:hypothetical protein